MIGYGATTFPALTEAVDANNSTLAQYEASRLADVIHHLTKALHA
jgi:hypothetical protein